MKISINSSPVLGQCKDCLLNPPVPSSSTHTVTASCSTRQICLYSDHYSRSKYCVSHNSFKVALSPRHCLCKRFICSSATPHQLLHRTSAPLAAAFLEDTQMSLFSSKSGGQGSNQRLSFLGKPQAFCKELWKLTAFMFSYAFCLGSLS